jgi:hypothetical protein
MVGAHAAIAPFQQAAISPGKKQNCHPSTPTDNRPFLKCSIAQPPLLLSVNDCASAFVSGENSKP